MQLPNIMICLLSKNEAKSLPQFFKAMEQLDYPKEKLRWVWMYGRSVDDTLSLIQEFHKKNSYKYEIYEEPVFERLLASSLYNARLCNEFKNLYKKEEFVLFIDSDVIEMPPETLKELVKVDKDIVAPYPYRKDSAGSEFFYDTYVFRFHGWKFERIEYQGKVFDYSNPIFKDEKKPVEIDSVGTCLLIKANVFLEVDWDNPVPHLQFCNKARSKGFKVWALPYLKIYHVDVTEINESPHFPLEWYVMRGILPVEEMEKVGYEKKEKQWVLKHWD